MRRNYFSGHQSLEDAHQTQSEVIRSILKRAKDSAIGKDFGFKNMLRSKNVLAQYMAEFPICEYEKLRPYIDRAISGEPNVITGGKIKYLATSSGTTGIRKLFPLSETYFQELMSFSKNSFKAHMEGLSKREILRGKVFGLHGYVEQNPDFPGMHYGELSGLFSHWSYQRKSGPITKYLRNKMSALSREIQDIQDWEVKLDKMAIETIDCNVTLASINPPWGLTFFKHLIEVYNDYHTKKVSTVGEIWPNLKIVTCGAVALKPFLKPLHDIIGLKDVRIFESFGATEGFFAFQDDLEDEAMLLNIDQGYFYEFIPYEQYQNLSQPERLSITEVRTGQRYVLLVTNFSGLYSYVVGDTVEFTQLAPFKIKFAGRINQVLDCWGEHIPVHLAQEALQQTCEDFNISTEAFHIAPYSSKDEDNRHEWIVEFTSPLSNPKVFAQALDQKFLEISPDYKRYRSRTGFEHLVLKTLPRGSFDKWKMSQPNLGAQFKIPVARNNRKVADELSNLTMS